MKLEPCTHWYYAFCSGKALTIQALHYRTLFFALERESFYSTWNIFDLERESFHSTWNIFALERERFYSRVFFCSGTRNIFALERESFHSRIFFFSSGTGKLSFRNMYIFLLLLKGKAFTLEYKTLFLWNEKAFTVKRNSKNQSDCIYFLLIPHIYFNLAFIKNCIVIYLSTYKL